MRYFIYLFWLLFILVCVSFVVLNSNQVTVNYYIGKSAIYLPLLLLLVLVVGSVFGIIGILPVLIRQKSLARKLKGRIKHIEQELNNLRTMPIEDRDTC